MRKPLSFLLVLMVFFFTQIDAKTERFKHPIQLQLADANGWPVLGTQFWVTLDIFKKGDLVTINLPLINFETGPVSTYDPFYPSGQIVPGIPPSGGYLYTLSGFLPEELRPTDLEPRSTIAASNNGMSPIFSFTQDPSTLPLPPVGYIVQVTNAGAIQVQGAGTFGNIILTSEGLIGPQVLLPCSITYTLKHKTRLAKNVQISTGATNVTQFSTSGNAPADTGFRDFHVNDAFDGVVAWTWTDNSNIEDQSNGTLNCMVVVGKTSKNGKLKIGEPLQLTNLPPGVFAWDTAVAINRSDKKNIVVSYSVLNAPGTPYRAVSFDGGKTWPENGPLNVGPTGLPGGNGDNRGVASDKFGNIWYSTTNLFDDLSNPINQPYFAASTDGGVTYQLVYSAPVTPPNFTPGVNFYDYPNFSFGTDNEGNYGLYFVVSYLNFDTMDGWPAVGFIPITGLGQFGTPSFTQLPGLAPALVTADISASQDGRLWIQGNNSGVITTPYNYIQPVLVAFKSPGGTLDLNWAGAWDLASVNNIGDVYSDNGQVPPNYPVPDSTTINGIINASTQSILFDDRRQALYAMVANQVPDYSQNMDIFFVISRDNGQTWSEPIKIANTSFGNREYQSMALDEVTGNLIFGWYDGRNDPTYQSVEYFGAILPAQQLDQLVECIPLSDPLFSLPSAGPVDGGG